MTSPTQNSENVFRLPNDLRASLEALQKLLNTIYDAEEEAEKGIEDIKANKKKVEAQYAELLKRFENTGVTVPEKYYDYTVRTSKTMG